MINMNSHLYVIKIMLKRRKESDTYLAAGRGHRRSTKIAMKIDKIGVFSQHCGFHQLKGNKNHNAG